MAVDFFLAEEQQILQETLRRFVADQVVPDASQWDQDGSVPPDMIQALASMGLLGVGVGAAWGGADLGPLELVLVATDLASGDGSLAAITTMHNAAAVAVGSHGSAAQKQELLGPMADGKIMATVALPTPEQGIELRAHKSQDGWRLSGKVHGVLMGTIAHVCVVLAREESEDGTWQSTAFLLHMDQKGLNRLKAPLGPGMRALGVAHLSLEAASGLRLGDSGEGERIFSSVALHASVGLGAVSLGLGRGALAAAREYALNRRQFGRPIAEFQAVGWKLADVATQLDAAELLLLRAAYLLGRGQRCVREAAMGRAMAAPAAVCAGDESIQIHGGYGYTRDFAPERLYRDAQTCMALLGPSEYQHLRVAEALLQQGRDQA